MPLIKARVPASARCATSGADYVLNQLIETTVAKDREFVAWRAAHRATSTPRPPTRARRSRAGACLTTRAEVIRPHRRWSSIGSC